MRHTILKSLYTMCIQICGVFQELKLMGGGKFFMALIDDISRKVWVCILKHKNEAFSKFKEWLTEQEDSRGKKFKHLRTVVREFQDYCKLKDRVRHKIIPANPQQWTSWEDEQDNIGEIKMHVVKWQASKGILGEVVNTAY